MNLNIWKTNLSVAIFTAFAIISGCGKNEDHTPKNLKAGEESSSIYSVSPPSPISIVSTLSCPNSADSSLCTNTKPSMPLDLNNDGNYDITFTSNKLANSLSSGPYLSVSAGTNISYSLKPIKEGEDIGDITTWETVTLGITIVGTPDNTMLAYSFSSWQYPQGNQQNNWEKPAYFAVKYQKGTRAYYGWIKLKIDNYNRLSVYSWGMQI